MAPASYLWGPIFIGIIFNVTIYGITIMQTALYYSLFRQDKWWLKVMVAVLFLCDTLNSAFDVALLYIPFVVHWDELHAIQYANWLSGADTAMTAIIASIVQMFFAWRLKILTGSWLLVAVIAFCSFGQWCGGMGIAIAIHDVPQFQQFHRFKVVVIVWLAFASLGDVIITVALVWYLRKHRTGFPEMDATINRIIRLTVSTGMLTALCAIAHLISFVSSTSGVYLAFNLPLPKLYTNSLLSSLNCRSGLGHGQGLSDILDTAMTSPVYARGGETQRDTTTGTQVLVEVEAVEIAELYNKTDATEFPAV